MQYFVFIGSILLVQIFAWFTPGPNIALILRNSLVYSRKSGAWTAFGIALGNFVHITYTVLGLIFVISVVPAVFIVIKYLGIGYLLYLGVTTMWLPVRSRVNTSLDENCRITPLHAVREGFITNILSPKAPLFFGSVFASVIEFGAPPWAVALLWVAMPMNSFLMAFLYSILFSRKRIHTLIVTNQRTAHILMGSILVILALIIAFR